MATYNNKPASVGLSDPKLVRQTETALAQAAIIARGKTTVTSAGELILPNTTLAVGANSVSTTTSANNSSADIVTVYSGQGAIYASSIDQTVNQTIVNNIGVNSIVAGNNITITSTGVSEGTGIVTVNAVLDGNNSPGGINTFVQFNDAGVFGGNTGFTFNKTTGVLAAPFFSGPGNSLSNIQGTNVTGAVAFAGTANSVALANVSGAGNIASINLTGSTSNVLYGNGVFAAVATSAGIANGTSNVTVPAVNGNVNLVSAGNTTMVVTDTGANIAGTLSVSGNATVGNIIATNIGNIASINLTGSTSNVLYGNGAFGVVSVTAFTANVNGNGFSLGNVGNVAVTGAISITGNANIGNIGTGGLITATGNITGANLVTAGVLSVTGNANIGNIGTEIVTATGNVTGANLVTGGVISATGNANVGNLGTGGLITATGNITGANLNTTGNVNAPIMVNGGTGVYLAAGPSGYINFFTTGGDKATITDTGNIAASNLIANSTVFATTANISGNVNAGNVTTGGVLTVTGNANVGNIGTTTLIATTGNITTINSGLLQNGNSNITITANGNISLSATGAPDEVVITSTGVNVAGTLSASGNITGANISTSGNISGNTNGFTIGYLNIPQVAASNTTIALTDAGKHYYSTTAGNFTLTIPNNATTSFATGTAISIVVQAAGNILANADTGVTLYMAGNSTAANRVVGGYGMATLMKVATDTWFIDGTGVS